MIENTLQKQSYKVEPDTYGSGQCRYWGYKFKLDENLYSLDQRGCSGPDGPTIPKEAIGTLYWEEIKTESWIDDIGQYCFAPK